MTIKRGLAVAACALVLSCPILAKAETGDAEKVKSTRIFVKEDGKWLCIHGHYTAVP